MQELSLQMSTQVMGNMHMCVGNVLRAWVICKFVQVHVVRNGQCVLNGIWYLYSNRFNDTES